MVPRPTFTPSLVAPPIKGAWSEAKKLKFSKILKNGRGQKLTRSEFSFDPPEWPQKVWGQSVHNFLRYGDLNVQKCSENLYIVLFGTFSDFQIAISPKVVNGLTWNFLWSLSRVKWTFGACQFPATRIFEDFWNFEVLGLWTRPFKGRGHQTWCESRSWYHEGPWKVSSFYNNV